MPDSSINTSFIPKKNSGGTGRSVGRRGRLGWPLLGSFLILLLVLAGWVGLELYTNNLEEQIDARQQTLAVERATLNTRAVEEILRADRRMKLADAVLQQHIAPSAILRELEQRTVDGLRYTTLSYEQDGPRADGVLTLEGEAHNFATVVVQADLFKQSPLFSGVAFSDLNKSTSRVSDGVVFTAQLTVPADAIRYRAASPSVSAAAESEVSGTADIQERNDT
ncbi:MAG: PilN domain-containing protein [Candidatus Paceibacterota bacterium]